jgi:hypothetical protein
MRGHLLSPLIPRSWLIRLLSDKGHSLPTMTQNNSKNISEVLRGVDEAKDPDVSILKLDARGVPLVPQPSDHKDDPLVYTLVLLCVGVWSANFSCRIGGSRTNITCCSYYASLHLSYSVRPPNQSRCRCLRGS